MKKFALVTLAAVVFASAAWAGFGLPKVNTGNSTVNSVVNKGADMAKNKAVEKIINDKLSKYNCTFKDDFTTTDTTCPLDKIINELTAWKGGLESTLVGNVSVNVKASANGQAEKALKSKLKVSPSSHAGNRAQEIRNMLYKQMSWWDYTVTSNTNEGNGLSIWVTVR
jgi:hypothetical protein